MRSLRWTLACHRARDPGPMMGMMAEVSWGWALTWGPFISKWPNVGGATRKHMGRIIIDRNFGKMKVVVVVVGKVGVGTGFGGST